jgi:hypothetical protein
MAAVHGYDQNPQDILGFTLMHPDKRIVLSFYRQRKFLEIIATPDLAETEILKILG